MNENSEQGQQDSEENKQKEPRSPVEWVSFSIALAILTTIVGLVLYRWASAQDQPPILSVTTNQEISQVESQFYVPFTLKNTGGETAESVEVTAQLIIDGKVEEEGTQNIDFLSGGEEESGAFIFSRNPKDGKLVMRVTGHTLP
ncbi:TIGR02588 family protein [Oscillatoria sp. FACHB-1406]|uniref:TIGR02588 family protein n=1 Tax=Oscillatoria sp. FACHB-1406 TaxID=2692846 RepID=UPI0016826E9A|nr:TIGR02588 family protein [Oscillatoria sp. FACHB-1406]MBD2578125.1 TIGR02588 family protein [Oscillatoria sp. FACHB-1406]